MRVGWVGLSVSSSLFQLSIGLANVGFEVAWRPSGLRLQLKAPVPSGSWVASHRFSSHLQLGLFACIYGCMSVYVCVCACVYVCVTPVFAVLVV